MKGDYVIKLSGNMIVYAIIGIIVLIVIINFIKSKIQEWKQERDIREHPENYVTIDEAIKDLRQTIREVEFEKGIRDREKEKYNYGLQYERYIGYLMEGTGYCINYVGAEEGKKDKGIDLLAVKGRILYVIQCKRWSKKSIVRENVILQLHGSVEIVRKENRESLVKGLLITTTKVSKEAKEIADKLNIEIREFVEYNKDYPKVKCIRWGKENCYITEKDKRYDWYSPYREGECYVYNEVDAIKKGYRKLEEKSSVAWELGSRELTESFEDWYDNIYNSET